MANIIPAARYQHAGSLAAAYFVSICDSSTQPRLKEMPPLKGLLVTLELLNQQIRMYEHALPLNDYPARAAVTVLGRLAQQALSEARDLAAAQELQPENDLPPRNGVSQPLSPRELEVLTLAAQGLTNKEIAYRLRLSERTVQFHMNSVFNKTATNSRTEAVALAIKSNWLPD